MAMDICSENPSSTLVMSPARISFSYDLSQSDAAPIEHHFRSNSPSSPGVDFDFCTQEACAQASSSADELFSDGKILPFRIKENVAPRRREIRPPEVLAPDLQCGKVENEEGLKEERKGAISESEEKHGSKSFWRFKRSSSLNCGSGYGPSLCPLPLLSRSNSTGSAASQKQNSKKNHPSVAVPKIPSQYSSTWGSYQKPPLKKSYGSYGNGGGVRVNPVLNVHSGNLFGLGSIFGKEKSKRK
ncbi:hypothetical protein C3L33_01393, partial [Rhododendron williamsianum]